MTLTPKGLSRAGDFYHQLGTLLEAGVPILQVLDQLICGPPARSYVKPLQRARSALERGMTFTEALASTGGWLPAFDLALLSAGEQSGRLDQCCRLLAEHYQQRSQLLRQTLSDLTYPLFVLHAAIFIFPFPRLVLTWNSTAYLMQTVGVLLPAYAAVFLLVLACQGRNGERWRSSLERLLGAVPVLGKARRNLALARLAASLEATLNAGVPIINAWELSATASGSPRLKRTVLSWRPTLESGTTPAELVRAHPVFSDVFRNLYSTAELSGTLDETLRRLSHYYQEEATRGFSAFAQWLPRLIYYLVIAYVATKVISFWTGYFGELEKVMGP